MASTNKGDGPPRPSWSKIAASGYVPPDARSGARSGATKTPSPSAEIPRPSTLSPDASRKIMPKQETYETKKQGDGRGTPAPVPGAIKVISKSTTSKLAEAAQNAASNEECSTQTSSDDSAKPLSFDTKSITSAATFALDEKESLRPDDSASMRAAIEEEDMFSAPGSVIAGSRVGSDFGARPFREQLQEIPYIVASQSRGTPGTLYVPPVSLVASMSGSSAPNLTANESQSSGPNATQDMINASPVPPDEKLVEALQSQRDRVWVLKLEQDIIDFVGQSREMSLTLPQCNAFYRMLAHKLADYYKLDHIVAQTGTGAAVVISKTSFARMSVTTHSSTLLSGADISHRPPPLSGIAIASNIADTPPLIATTRKIMRRAGDQRSETTTAANSEGPSASVSEVGIDVPAAAGAPSASKTKALLTREEREKQYAEVRERIFGKAEPGDGNDVAASPDDADQSRSSSATGKKANVRRQRNLSDDDFEPRSQFPAQYTGSNYAVTSSMPQNSPFYAHQPAFHSGQQYGNHQLNDPSPAYGSLQAMQFSNNGQTAAWASQFYSTAPSSEFSQGMTPGYDMSAHLQSAMQLSPNHLHGSSNGGGYGPIPFSHPYASTIPTSAQPPMSAWQPSPPQFNHTYNSQPYSMPPYISQGQSLQPQFGFSNMPLGQSMAEIQHMQPQQFNPQSQAFIPSMPMSPYTQMSPVATQYQQFGAVGQSPSPSYGLAPSFSSSPRLSPIPQHASTSPFHLPTGPGHHASKTSHSQDHRVRNKQRANVGQTTNNSSTGSGEPSMEITAKFGMPAHLPARPPPPQSMEPHKFHELNRGGMTGMPRMSSPNGATASNKSPTTVRNGPSAQPSSSQQH